MFFLCIIFFYAYTKFPSLLLPALFFCVCSFSMQCNVHIFLQLISIFSSHSTVAFGYAGNMKKKHFFLFLSSPLAFICQQSFIAKQLQALFAVFNLTGRYESGSFFTYSANKRSSETFMNLRCPLLLNSMEPTVTDLVQHCWTFFLRKFFLIDKNPTLKALITFKKSDIRSQCLPYLSFFIVMLTN